MIDTLQWAEAKGNHLMPFDLSAIDEHSVKPRPVCFVRNLLPHWSATSSVQSLDTSVSIASHVLCEIYAIDHFYYFIFKNQFRKWKIVN